MRATYCAMCMIRLNPKEEAYLCSRCHRRQLEAYSEINPSPWRDNGKTKRSCAGERKVRSFK